jgi:hypothetical protein
MPPETDVPASQPAKTPDPPTELPWYIAWFRREKATMKGAPISFVGCVIICTGLMCIGIYWFIDHLYEAEIKGKNATIEDLQNKGGDTFYKNVPYYSSNGGANCQPSPTNEPDYYTTGISILRATIQQGWPIDGQVTTFHQIDGSWLQFDCAYLGDGLAYRTGHTDLNTGISSWRGWNYFSDSKAVISLANNSLPATAISVDKSPFNWTNIYGKNIFVFVDRDTASTISVNGSKILSSSGDATIPLQNGEWVTVVYTNAPEMSWKPF